MFKWILVALYLAITIFFYEKIKDPFFEPKKEECATRYTFTSKRKLYLICDLWLSLYIIFWPITIPIGLIILAIKRT